MLLIPTDFERSADDDYSVPYIHAAFSSEIRSSEILQGKRRGKKAQTKIKSSQ
jgi:hypothetical protein